MKIKAYTAYTESNNTHFYREFDIVDSLPTDEVNGDERKIIKNVSSVSLDCEQSNDEVYDYDFYAVTFDIEQKDEDGNWIANIEDEVEYIAIRKPLEAYELLECVRTFFLRHAEGCEDISFYDCYEAKEYLDELNEAAGEEMSFEEMLGISAPAEDEYLLHTVNKAGEGKAYIVGIDGYDVVKEAVEDLTDGKYTLDPNGDVRRAR